MNGNGGYGKSRAASKASGLQYTEKKGERNMHKLTSFEVTAAFVVLFLGCVIIIAMIAAGFKIASDAKVQDAEESVNRRADRLARQMMRERLEGLQIIVTQRIDVIEDDLKGGAK